MNLRLTCSAFFFLSTLVASADALLAQSYHGVGGRHEQQIGAIQRNSTLTSDRTPAVVNASGSNRRIFVRFQADTGRNITGFDIKMRYRILGEVVPAWLYTADANNRPASIVASGEIGIGIGARFCRASFSSAYRVTGNTLYFLAFQLPAGETLEFSTASGGPATTVTYFVTPNGTAQNAGIQFLVNADGFSPSISMTQPRIGRTFDVGLTGAALNQPAILLLSIHPLVPAIDLHRYGSPGSFFYLQSMSILATVPGNATRRRSAVISVANDPSLVGLPINLQWFVATNDALGAVTSNAAVSICQP